MTEDDTFRVLSRASVDEMLRHYHHWCDSFLTSNTGTDALEKLCKKHGWTWTEFCTEGAIREEELNPRKINKGN